VTITSAGVVVLISIDTEGVTRTTVEIADEAKVTVETTTETKGVSLEHIVDFVEAIVYVLPGACLVTVLV
jgi:hypothetical protein